MTTMQPFKKMKKPQGIQQNIEYATNRGETYAHMYVCMYYLLMDLQSMSKRVYKTL